jgi:hypothetical protein
LRISKNTVSGACDLIPTCACLIFLCASRLFPSPSPCPRRTQCSPNMWAQGMQIPPACELQWCLYRQNPRSNVSPAASFLYACGVIGDPFCPSTPFASPSEWVVNQHRDTFSSMMGHPNLLDQVAIFENQSRERTRFNLLKVRTLKRAIRRSSGPHKIPHPPASSFPLQPL